jgi:hypothetical protein
MRRLHERGIHPRVYVGGRLTEDVGSAKSVDVSARITRSGAVPCASVEQMIHDLSRHQTERITG